MANSFSLIRLNMMVKLNNMSCFSKTHVHYLIISSLILSIFAWSVFDWVSALVYRMWVDTRAQQVLKARWSVQQRKSHTCQCSMRRVVSHVFTLWVSIQEDAKTKLKACPKKLQRTCCWPLHLLIFPSCQATSTLSQICSWFPKVWWPERQISERENIFGRVW